MILVIQQDIVLGIFVLHWKSWPAGNISLGEGSVGPFSVYRIYTFQNLLTSHITQFWSTILWKPTRQGLFRGQLDIIWPMTATAPPAAPTPRAGPKNPMPPKVHTCLRLCTFARLVSKCFCLWRIYPAYQRLKLQVQRCRRRWLN